VQFIISLMSIVRTLAAVTPAQKRVGERPSPVLVERAW